jgi:predicted transposase YbfD/YdcC
LPKKTFKCAKKVGATLITQVKDNQEGLRKQVAHGCNIKKARSTHQDPVDKAHGRIEWRKYEVFDSEPVLKNWKRDWPYIGSVIRVTRYREEKRKKPKKTIHYYVSNNKDMNAEEFGGYIRKHWYIENKLHHVKDTAFMEDKCTKVVNPFIYSTCIDMALNTMKARGVENIRGELVKNSFNLRRSIRLLDFTFTP